MLGHGPGGRWTCRLSVPAMPVCSEALGCGPAQDLNRPELVKKAVWVRAEFPSTTRNMKALSLTNYSAGILCKREKLETAK